MAKSEISLNDVHICRRVVIIQYELIGSKGHDSGEDYIYQKGVIQLFMASFHLYR